jgi:hypothetical protein
MNHYTQLIEEIRGVSSDLVNTISHGNFEDVDLSKSNIFPLMHIFVSGGRLNNGSTIQLDVQLGCFQQRNSFSDITEDKVYSNDNQVDNMNETLAIINTVWNKLLMDFDSSFITASENPDLEPVENAYSNGLDGWILSFTLEMPNEKLRLC